MIPEIVALAAVLIDLRHQVGVIVDGGRALHLSPFHNFGGVVGLVQMVGRAHVERIAPDIGSLAAMLVPPTAGAALGGRAQMVAVGLQPRLGGPGSESIVGNDRAAGVEGLHFAEDPFQSRILQIGTGFVL